MEFTTLTPEEFSEYAEKSPYKSFMQTPEIAQYRESNGWTPYYLGVKKHDELLAACLLVAKPTFLGKSTFLAPGGPLFDLENTALTNFFFKKLKQFVKSHNGYTLHISPYYEYVERDRDGEKVAGGFYHKKARQNLLNLGFKPLKHSSVPTYQFVMDINGRTKDEIFADFKRNTRNHIRKAEKQGVTIRELKRDELKHLKTITDKTAHRRDFTDQPLSYYESMYDLLTPRNAVKFLLAEANIDGKQTDLSAAMFITYGDEVVYLFSGSDEAYMRDYNAQYLIQWYMIQHAVDHNFKKYNFYGINELPNRDSKDYGIYDFKKGFGGHVVELIGSYELPVNQAFYTLYNLLAKFKNLFHHA